mgnify:CR=1 FL=1
MLKKLKKMVAFMLCLTMAFGISTTAMAAEIVTEDEPIVIELFDEDSPYLIEIVETSGKERTTSAPTSVWNMATQGSYSYSAYSSNNIMWSKYIFFDPGNIGEFIITAKSTNTNYRMRFYDVLNGREFIYSVPSTNVTWKTASFSGWNNADEFYFGVDTKASGGSVSVNGVVSY